MKTIILISLFINILVSCTPKEKGPTLIYYPKTSYKKNIDVYLDVIKASLKETVKEYGEFKLIPSDKAFNSKQEIFNDLSNNKNISLYWNTGKKELENKNLSPIPIPIRMGVIGYRIFITREDFLPTLKAVNFFRDLKKYSVAQLESWDSAKVFKMGGFKVITTKSKDDLLKLVSSGKVDLVSRSVSAAYKGIKKWRSKYPNLRIDENLMVFYPWPKFFYLHNSNKVLFERIQKGFEIIVKKGIHRKLTLKHHSKHIPIAKLDKRKLFKIPVHFLSQKTPWDREELWYDPFEK